MPAYRREANRGSLIIATLSILRKSNPMKLTFSFPVDRCVMWGWRHENTLGNISLYTQDSAYKAFKRCYSFLFLPYWYDNLNMITKYNIFSCALFKWNMHISSLCHFKTYYNNIIILNCPLPLDGHSSSVLLWIESEQTCDTCWILPQTYIH